MEPGACLAGGGPHCGEVVEGARVDLTRLADDDGRAGADRLQLARERGGVDPAEAVAGDRVDRPPADPQVAQGAVDGDVALLAADDTDRRRARQAVLLDVPAGRAQHAVACRGEAGEVRHLAAGDEAVGDGRRQAEQLDEPGARNFLDHRRARPADVEAGVLVPRRREPVGAERRGHRPADHEAEVAPAGHPDDARLRGGGQLADDALGVARPLGQRPAQRGAQLLDGGGGEDRPVGQPGQVTPARGVRRRACGWCCRRPWRPEPCRGPSRAACRSARRCRRRTARSRRGASGRSSAGPARRAGQRRR